MKIDIPDYLIRFYGILADEAGQDTDDVIIDILQRQKKFIQGNVAEEYGDIMGDFFREEVIK